MNKSTEKVLMILFAVLAVGFAVLFLSANGRIGALNREKEPEYFNFFNRHCKIGRKSRRKAERSHGAAG